VADGGRRDIQAAAGKAGDDIDRLSQSGRAFFDLVNPVMKVFRRKIQGEILSTIILAPPTKLK
jgi:hypothetical protein